MARFQKVFEKDSMCLRLQRLPLIQQNEVYERFPNLDAQFFQNLQDENFEEVEVVANWIREMIQDGFEWSAMASNVLKYLEFLPREFQREENRGREEDTIEEAERRLNQLR